MKLNTFLTIVLALLIGATAGPLVASRTHNLGGTAYLNANYYNSATNASVVCSGAVSTVLLATSSRADNRIAFDATVASTTSITLCRAATCTQASGLTIVSSASSSAGIFHQQDAYSGAYSCIGNGASSTVGISYSQG
jgi:hypothetical protein